MLPGKLKELIEKALGPAYDPQVRYVVTTPAGVPNRLRGGCKYLANFRGEHGEDLVVMEAEDVYRQL